MSGSWMNRILHKYKLAILNGGFNNKTGNVNVPYNVLGRLKMTNIFKFNRLSYGENNPEQWFKCWIKCFVTEISYEGKIGGGVFPMQGAYIWHAVKLTGYLIVVFITYMQWALYSFQSVSHLITLFQVKYFKSHKQPSLYGYLQWAIARRLSVTSLAKTLLVFGQALRALLIL